MKLEQLLTSSIKGIRDLAKKAINLPIEIIDSEDSAALFYFQLKGNPKKRWGVIAEFNYPNDLTEVLTVKQWMCGGRAIDRLNNSKFFLF